MLYIATYDPLNLYKLLSIFDSQQKAELSRSFSLCFILIHCVSHAHLQSPIALYSTITMGTG